MKYNDKDLQLVQQYTEVIEECLVNSYPEKLDEDIDIVTAIRSIKGKGRREKSVKRRLLRVGGGIIAIFLIYNVITIVKAKYSEENKGLSYVNGIPIESNMTGGIIHE